MTDLKWTPVTIRLGEIEPWSDNPRMSTKAQAERLIQSERELGQVQTVAVGPVQDNGKHPLYDGHQRVSAWFTVKGADFELTALQSNRPLTEDERRKMAVLLHTATGGWNWDRLAGWRVGELKEWGLVNQENVKGWNADALNVKELLKAEQETVDAEPQIDRAAELLEKWKVKTGDLWQIGEHRLICGDCTDAAVVERVMGGERARVVFTSPPYSNQRDYEIGDFDWLLLANGFIDRAFEICDHVSDVIVNLGLEHSDGKVNQYWQPWLSHCEENGQSLYGWYVWDQGEGYPGDYHGRLARAFEFVFHFSNGHAQANKWIKTLYTPEDAIREKEHHRTGPRTGSRQKDGSISKFSADTVGQPYKIPDSVIRVGREKARGIHTQSHPATFSIDFAEFVLQTWGETGCIVYEPFSGSGTTIVACQNLGRKCRAIEISPAYVAVALERMAQAFPELEIKRIDSINE